MKVNKHGLTMQGLRKAVGNTKGLRGYRGGAYLQINYDRSDGEILTNYFCDLSGSWHAKYHDPAIIRVCTTYNPMTMQEIADAIHQAVAEAAQDSAS